MILRYWLLFFIIIGSFKSQCQQQFYYFTPELVHKATLKLNSNIPPVFYYAINKRDFIIHNTTGYHTFICYLDSLQPFTLSPQTYKTFQLKDINENSILIIKYVDSFFKRNFSEMEYKRQNMVHLLDSLHAASARTNIFSPEKMLKNIYQRDRDLPKVGQKIKITEYDLEGNQYQSERVVTSGDVFDATLSSYSLDLIAMIGYLQIKNTSSEDEDNLTDQEYGTLLIAEVERDAIDIMQASKGKKTAFSYLFQPQAIFKNIIYGSNGRHMYE